MKTFMELLSNRWQNANTVLCVGLDPDYDKIPPHLKEGFNSETDVIYEFNKGIIDETHEYVCCYKPQYAFYAALGDKGLAALKKTIEYIHSTYPDIPVLLDSKRGDIGNTTPGYIRESFEVFSADAVTINPYIGFDSIEPFIEQKDKGIVILCRTSNRSASDFQDIVDEKTKLPLYQLVAQKAVEWNKNKNILLVVGATHPDEMKQIREIVGDDIPFLIPGIGAQGGKVEDIKNGLDSNNAGVIVNSSRGIIFASNTEDFAQKAGEEAKKLRDELNNYR